MECAVKDILKALFDLFDLGHVSLDTVIAKYRSSAERERQGRRRTPGRQIRRTILPSRSLARQQPRPSF